MEPTNKHINLIDRIIRNEATEAERVEFKSLLASDEAFKKQYEFTKDFNEVSKSNAQYELKDRLRAIEQESSKEKVQATDEPIAKSRSLVFYLSRAAAALLLLAACWFLMPKETQQAPDLFAANFSSHPNELSHIDRGEGQNNSQLKEAFLAYQQNEHTKASQLFSSLHKQGGSDDLLFYESISLLHLDKSNEALKNLESLSEKDLRIQNEVIHWYLALAQIKTGDTAAAKISLQKVLDAEGSFRKTSSRSIMEQLK